jgi:transcriptional regulator with XRE-family HTH domain
MRYDIGRCLIDDRLREAEMTRSQLADKIGMDRRQLSRYATKGAIMTFANAVLIADIIGCNPRDLYEWIPVR